MRLASLFLRSRRAGRVALILAAVALACLALTWLLVAQTPYGVAHGGLTITLVFGALAAACVVGASAGSSFGDTERTVSLPLAPLRFGHLGSLLLWSMLVLCAAVLAFDLEDARPAYSLLVLLRDLAGLGGMALLTARLAGARLSWMPPFALSIAYLTAMGSGSDVLAAFANRSYHGLHGPSWAVALLLLAMGMCAVSLYGAHESPGETG